MDISNFDKVEFIIFYGSRAIGKYNKNSDYDLAIYFNGNKKERYNFLINANFDKRFDVKVFQDIPLFIKKEILKGRVIYCKDIRFVYDVVYQTLKEIELFKRHYYDYIKTRSLRVK